MQNHVNMGFDQMNHHPGQMTMDHMNHPQNLEILYPELQGKLIDNFNRATGKTKNLDTDVYG